MAKQLMIYDRAVPISSDRHRDWSVRSGGNYAFAQGINSVPVVAAEFRAAATDYAIVFAGDEGTVFPSVILGTAADRNDHVGPAGEWAGGYIPAFLRRYPFVFARSEDGQTFTLCIDEEFEGVNQENRGERLFDADGNRTQYLQTMLSFNREYQAFVRADAGLLRATAGVGAAAAGQAQISLPDGERRQIGGFFTIDREKLKALPADTLAQMVRTDELELCYVHLQSLNNLTPMVRRTAEAGRMAAPVDQAPAPETIEAEG
jgi:hypothetical protein